MSDADRTSTEPDPDQPFGSQIECASATGYLSGIILFLLAVDTICFHVKDPQAGAALLFSPVYSLAFGFGVTHTIRGIRHWWKAHGSGEPVTSAILVPLAIGVLMVLLVLQFLVSETCQYLRARH